MTENRKQRSEKLMGEKGIPVVSGLPLYISEENCHVRTPYEIVRRLTAAITIGYLTIFISEGKDVRKSAEELKSFHGFLDELTKHERDVYDVAIGDVKRELTHDEICDMTWRIERSVPLLWACGFMEEDYVPFPSEPSDLQEFLLFFFQSGSFDELEACAEMASDSEIFDYADLAYRIDWSCFDMYRRGAEIPECINWEVAAEHHKGFKWLICAEGAEEWDRIHSSVITGGTHSAEMRKLHSEDFLCSSGIPVNPDLPVIALEETAKIRTAEEILKRAVPAFLAANIAVEAAGGGNVRKSAAFFRKKLIRLGMENELTDEEKELFDWGERKNDKIITPDESKKIYFRAERTIPLFWAAGILGGDIEYPRKYSRTDMIEKAIFDSDSFEQLMSRVKLHTAGEILDNADEVYRMNWACYFSFTTGKTPPAGLFYDVVKEQNKGFSWLIGIEDNWDNINDSFEWICFE